MRVAGTAIPFVALCLLAGAAQAQSSLSIQGFGYPPGQLSVRALATGGAISELDPLSQLNPASVGRWGRAGVAVHFLPETRTVSGPEGSDGATVMRFPVYAAGVSLAQRWMLGVTSSTLLDATWTSQFESTDELGGEEVQSVTLWSSQGAINDVALAVAYSVTPQLQLGFAGHLYTGSNRVSVATRYASPDFGDLSVSTNFTYSGNAVSAGAVWSPSSVITVGASARLGGSLFSERDGGGETSADIPDRIGVSLAYTGIANTTVAISYAQVAFSALNGLGSETTIARDTDEMGVGLEVPGPVLLGSASLLRTGARFRSLPFDAAGSEVRETTFSAGLGLPFARGRAAVDLGILRLTRSNDSAYRESAWAFGMGILVRP